MKSVFGLLSIIALGRVLDNEARLLDQVRVRKQVIERCWIRNIQARFLKATTPSREGQFEASGAYAERCMDFGYGSVLRPDSFVEVPSLPIVELGIVP